MTAAGARQVLWVLCVGDRPVQAHTSPQAADLARKWVDGPSSVWRIEVYGDDETFDRLKIEAPA